MPVVLRVWSVLTTRVAIVRLMEILFGCIAFSLGIYTEGTNRNLYEIFCKATWGSFFLLTILIFFVEFTQFQTILPVSWKNLPITVASFGGFMNGAAAIIFPLFVIRNMECLTQMNRNHCIAMIAATAFSCLNCLAYGAEVYLIKMKQNEQHGYMASSLGLLKVFEVFASIIIFISVDKEDTGTFKNIHFFWWCIAVYCTCSLWSFTVIVIVIAECTGKCPFPFGRVLAAFSTFSVLLYISAIAYWTNFIDDKLEQKCSTAEDCRWMKVVIAAVMTGLNLIAYTLDCVYSLKKMCLRVETT
ncbi:myeloid-associated differentiation marker homolog [Protopterus annectens]|uniref:myeloid-associated differentiation marker homolog n=1 Tax=Protopterus annectens TaxID=7888 RepID=UPI001CFAA1F9|nr:myeloid-associated differentiation marker homolog [Protopterus annectens]